MNLDDAVYSEEVSEISKYSKAELFFVDEKGTTLLMKAAEWNKPKSSEILIQLGADINNKNHYGRTAIHIAANSGNIEVTKVLLAANADLLIKDNNGFLPIISSLQLTLGSIDSHLTVAKLIANAMDLDALKRILKIWIKQKRENLDEKYISTFDKVSIILEKVDKININELSLEKKNELVEIIDLVPKLNKDFDEIKKDFLPVETAIETYPVEQIEIVLKFSQKIESLINDLTMLRVQSVFSFGIGH